MFKRKPKPEPSLSEQIESAVADALAAGTDARRVADALEARAASLRIQDAICRPHPGANPTFMSGNIGRPPTPAEQEKWRREALGLDEQP